MSHRLRNAALALALASAIAGCSAEPASQPSPAGELAQLIQPYIAQAKAYGYSEQQVAALEKASAEGGLQFEDVSGAVDLSLECIANAGYYVERKATDYSQGYPVVDYFYESPEAGNAVADECIRVNSEALEAVYQLQPSSVEAKNASLESKAQGIAECLQNQGVDVNFEGLTGEDLKDAVYDAVDAQLKAAAAAGTDPTMDCFLVLSQ